MNFKRTPTVIFLCVLPLLIALGLWQLGRADQKRVLLEQREQGMSSAEILSLSDGIVDNVDVLKFKKVKLNGHYDAAHQFLIDNQIS